MSARVNAVLTTPENTCITIIVNGAPLSTQARSVAEIVAVHAPGGVKVATAVNGHFVPEPQRATTILSPGDRVEIVSPRQGG
jgi:sulfur carrier protein